jgi:hypothetical protein
LACSVAAAAGVKKTDSCLDVGLRNDRFAGFNLSTAAMPANSFATARASGCGLPSCGSPRRAETAGPVQPSVELDRRVGDALDKTHWTK